MEECRIENLYNLDQTIAKDIFEGVTYPWEVLPKIEEFIMFNSIVKARFLFLVYKYIFAYLLDNFPLCLLFL